MPMQCFRLFIAFVVGWEVARGVWLGVAFGIVSIVAGLVNESLRREQRVDRNQT